MLGRGECDVVLQDSDDCFVARVCLAFEFAYLEMISIDTAKDLAFGMTYLSGFRGHNLLHLGKGLHMTRKRTDIVCRGERFDIILP
jgi:hypothetical protein